VQHAAGALEHAIRYGSAPEDVDRTRREISAHLDPLVAALEHALAEFPPDGGGEAAPTTPVDPTTSRELAAQLLTLLSDLDPGAAEFVDAHRAALRPVFTDGTWREFEMRVQDYAFPDAQAHLERALTTFACTEASP
jgi:hypothetical protein